MSSSGGFSGVVQLSEVDDFIAPSQSCIKPLTKNSEPLQNKTSVVPKRNRKSNSNNKIVSANNVSNAQSAVTITLNDCLACSGCVTSAETILIEQQSHSQLNSFLVENLGLPTTSRRTVVVSVSPQSRASLAHKFNMSIKEMVYALGTFFCSLGASFMVDTTFSRSFSLAAAQQEFEQRKKRPLFASACPGWICYAEKTHGELLVPYISRVRSPQAVAGAIVKDYLASEIGVRASDIYHACIMPCFDKKLEASRDEFLVPGTADIRQVDCVLSTAELVSLMKERDFDPTTASASEPTLKFVGTFDENGELCTHDDNGSGGYLCHILEQCSQNCKSQITIQRQRINKDLEEISLLSDGETVFKGALAYGFRNIQNIVQKIKRNKCNYDYVEIMACPSGCLNGGGQIRPETHQQAAQLLAAVTEKYKSATSKPETEFNRVLSTWLGDVGSEKAKIMLYTDYRPVPKTLTMQNMRW